MTDPITLSGTVAHVFAHRFTLCTENGTVLADLGPKGAETIALKPGDAVSMTGERKPSEIKVHSLIRGGDTVTVPHGDKHKPHGRKDGSHKGEAPAHAPADPRVARAAVEQAGLRPVGEARRKPKHFEVLARDPDGRHHELHVDLDGALRKRKPVAPDDAKWAEALKAA